jgi:hypothetical protein
LIILCSNCGKEITKKCQCPESKQDREALSVLAISVFAVKAAFIVGKFLNDVEVIAKRGGDSYVEPGRRKK